MKYTEAIREILKVRNISQASLAKSIGVTPQLLCKQLNKDNITIASLIKMADALQYKVVLVPNTKTLKEGEYEVE